MCGARARGPSRGHDPGLDAFASQLLAQLGVGRRSGTSPARRFRRAFPVTQWLGEPVGGAGARGDDDPGAPGGRPAAGGRPARRDGEGVVAFVRVLKVAESSSTGSRSFRSLRCWCCDGRCSAGWAPSPVAAAWLRRESPAYGHTARRRPARARHPGAGREIASSTDAFLVLNAANCTPPWTSCSSGGTGSPVGCAVTSPSSRHHGLTPTCSSPQISRS